MTGAFEKFKGRDSQSTDRAARMTLSADQQRVLIEGLETAIRGCSVYHLEARRNAQLIDLYQLKTAGGSRNA